jgi:hypothetical protein
MRGPIWLEHRDRLASRGGKPPMSAPIARRLHPRPPHPCSEPKASIPPAEGASTRHTADLCRAVAAELKTGDPRAADVLAALRDTISLLLLRCANSEAIDGEADSSSTPLT